MESASQLLTIELARPQPVFFAGQTVEGCVRMPRAVHARLAARTGHVDVALRLDALACALPRTPPNSAQPPAPATRTLSTQGPLRLRLAPDASAPAASDAAAPFRFVLPEAAPPTLVTRHGYVAHVLRAEVALADGVVRALVRPLGVLGLADGGAPRYLAGAERSDTLPARCGGVCGACGACGACAGLAGVAAHLGVARTAWACGEWLEARVALATASPRVLARAAVSLRQRTAFYPARDTPAHTLLAVSERVLVHRCLADAQTDAQAHRDTAQMGDSAASPGGGGAWRVWLRVPPCCPSATRAATQLVDVAYYLVLSVAPDTAQLRVPVTVVARPAPSGDAARDARASPAALVRAAVDAGAAAAALSGGSGGSARGTAELAHAEDTPLPADLGPFVQYPCFRLPCPCPCPSASAAAAEGGGSEHAPLLAGQVGAVQVSEVAPDECGTCIFCPPAPLYLPDEMFPTKGR